jgi:hypothetical protein
MQRLVLLPRGLLRVAAARGRAGAGAVAGAVRWGCGARRHPCVPCAPGAARHLPRRRAVAPRGLWMLPAAVAAAAVAAVAGVAGVAATRSVRGAALLLVAARSSRGSVRRRRGGMRRVEELARGCGGPQP